LVELTLNIVVQTLLCYWVNSKDRRSSNDYESTTLLFHSEIYHYQRKYPDGLEQETQSLLVSADPEGSGSIQATAQ